ncbi:RagB/SusD family nutrient uptake outer membrane protein [Myroides pelagicus]|uniref:RagB/SusD family nutrient uptake outer membrane protein n=1 Tax=Myroides pelagicus TaxID=270914 RepID=A0A7K1GNH6_9FLAO|nr:RagB/SusD family nutrient uptake outer membrane protein [Myroides pelagicus]MEC4114375.1 RagB/SusD family nutrient uptake outer membrane protein [Myroides pelagicus]MTH30099.1 RagB/SusD family nutrient uptake outer membrane protein [Myroides pelagicus]
MKKIIILLSGLLIGLTTVSCDKFLDVEPIGKVIPRTTEDYRKIMVSAYNKYPNHKSLSNFRTDEVKLILDPESTNFMSVKDVYTYQDLNPSKQTLSFGYQNFYEVIFYANDLINNGSESMEAGADKEQLLGEAYALRALAHFDLTNLYAKPYDPATAATAPAIVITTKHDIENQRPKSTMAEVYAQVHADINQAKKHLKVTSYEAGKNYRFTIAALYALEAKVNLYQKRYQAALESVEKALTYKSELQDLNTNTDVSVASFESVESILALEDGLISGLQTTALLSDELYSTYDRENDLRFNASFEKVEQGKYLSIKTGTGAAKASFRTAELYFIKAEALAFTNNLEESKNTIKEVITKRYKTEAVNNKLQQLNGLDQTALLSFLLDERNKEFAFEGHRWFDLRRLNQKEIVHKFENETYTLSANDLRYTLPFPKEARETNPNL